MTGFKRLSLYFSMVALIISVIFSIVIRVSPAKAFIRIIVSVIYFYILGYCISVSLTGKEKETKKAVEVVLPLQGDEEKTEEETEFEELIFPVIGSKDQE